MTVLLWVDALLFSLWFLTAVLCVLICRLMPSSPRKTSLSRSASSWTPARELGLTLPPGGKKTSPTASLLTNSHLRTTVRRTHARLWLQLLYGTSTWKTTSQQLAPVHFHTIVVHCKYQTNKSTVFISWYLTCMLMLKLAFSSIKHGKMVIYYCLLPFWCFWTRSVSLST